ncbi:MAG: restriction endonuclease [Phycisphaerae bacterium]|jgi:hypothetical protein
MNYWTDLSITYASQRSYLDDLFRVYPTVPEGIRDVDNSLWNEIETAFNGKNDIVLLKKLLKLKLFPIKDSYVAYLRRDKHALEHNPATVSRICGRLYEMGLSEIFKKSSEAKETNRQIGPLFKRWIESGVLGVPILQERDFVLNNSNAILRGSDNQLADFAKRHLCYTRNKGLDFIGRFNGKYVIGESKFLTDFGGHQNAQFNDAIELLKLEAVAAMKIAILDGVLYIGGKSKMHNFLKTCPSGYNILSALVLREFLYQL